MKISGVVGSWSVDPADVVYEIENSTGDLEIKLDSVGGSAMGGISIANAIREYNKGTVTIVVDSVSASIASYLMMFADKVVVHDNTTVMIHNAWLPAIGDFNALRKSADISEGLSGIIAKAYVSRTGKKENDIKNLMNEETYYYGADIVANGFADELIETKTEETEAQNKALILTKLEACNNAIMKNESVSLEAVAKLIPTKEDDNIESKRLEDERIKAQQLEDETTRLADLNAKQKRDRQLSILKKRK